MDRLLKILNIDFFINEKKKLLEEIKKDKLNLLNEEDKDNTYMLDKVLAWQEDYNYIGWEEFKDYVYCDRCKGWNPGQCICYAR